MRYIPSGYTLCASDERFGFEVYRASAPTIAAIAFGGRRTKPDWHFRFSSEAALQNKIAETLRGFELDAERKAARKAERNAPHDVAVGDVFVCSWGYDQTNIDYFQCTAVFGAMIEVREIGAIMQHTGDMQGRCVPNVGHFIGEPMRKRVCSYGDEPAVKIYSYAHATRIKPINVGAGAKVFASHSWTAYA